MIDSTLYLNEESARKQLTMPHWAVSALQKQPNRPMSKGLTAYEALLLVNDEYNDALSEIESAIDDDISRQEGDTFLRALNKIKSQSNRAGEETLAAQCEHDDPHEPVERVNVHLPVSLVNQLTVQRGLGDHIADALARVAEMPWSSRAERIRAKQQLAKVARGESVDDPLPVVEAVINDDCSRWNVSELHAIIVEEKDWWERDDIEVTDLQARGSEIPQTRKARVPALARAFANYEGNPTRSAVINLAKSAFDCHLKSAETYADELEEEWDIEMLADEDDEVDEEAVARQTETINELRTYNPLDHVNPAERR